MRPCRDAVFFELQKPGVETPGYCQMFLRNIYAEALN
jgi:hypothetical protein